MATEFETMMEDGEEESSESKVIFTMPDGDAEFDELRPGEKMRVRATIRKEEGGKACLVAVNGAEVSGYAEEEEEETEEESEEGPGAFEEMLTKEM